MKANKILRTNITWKVKFWVMPVLYLLAWGGIAYSLASLQAMTIGISIFLLINLCIFCLLFKSQFNQVGGSVADVLFIECVISRKVRNSFLVWVPLVVVGALLGVIGFIVLSTIAMWLSAFVFLFSSSKDFNIISPNIAYEDNVKFKRHGRRNILIDEDRKKTLNPAAGLPLVTGKYVHREDESIAQGGYKTYVEANGPNRLPHFNPASGMPMLDTGFDVIGNVYGTNSADDFTHNRGFGHTDTPGFGLSEHHSIDISPSYDWQTHDTSSDIHHHDHWMNDY